MTLPGSFHLSDIGTRLSWSEFKAVVRWAPAGSALARELAKQQAAERERQRIDALPDDERPIGNDPLPADEMLTWLGWN